MRLLCALGLFLALLHVTSCLRIGAFNIQQFGPKKSQNKEVMDRIKQIVQRYDIILIQEVLDKDGTVTKRLMALVNQGSPTRFRNISSGYLGPPDPGSHKERYLFLYKHNKVTVKDSFQYTGTGFMRPPFVVKFSSTQTGVEFVLIPIHTSPLTAARAARKNKKSTVEELKALGKVVDAAKQKWKKNNIMVLGDFNAGGKFVKGNDLKDIHLLFNEKGFQWLIDDNVNTTLGKSPKAYDRIVVSHDMNKGVVKDSAMVFNFRDEYGLGDEAKKVSDHFPVEVRLELKPEVELRSRNKKRNRG